MFVDSASRLQGLYGPREKSVAAIIPVDKRFMADMGVPRASTRTVCSWTSVLISEFVASLRHLILVCRSRMVPLRTLYCELSRMDTRRDSEFRKYIKLSV